MLQPLRDTPGMLDLLVDIPLGQWPALLQCARCVLIFTSCIRSERPSNEVANSRCRDAVQERFACM
jgi:hypothetical protein